MIGVNEQDHYDDMTAIGRQRRKQFRKSDACIALAVYLSELKQPLLADAHHVPNTSLQQHEARTHLTNCQTILKNSALQGLHPLPALP